MTIGTLDFSMWPPALVFAFCVIFVVCKVLPDVLTFTRPLPTSRPLSTAGTRSPVPSTATKN